jgi:SH3 domain-containing YSC84-like protein 1
MKKVVLGFTLLSLLATQAVAQDREEDRVEKAGTVISEIMNIPDNVPQDVIDKADCVVVLPTVLKLAFGIGGSYGRGVMTCRGGKTFHGPWSAPTMMALEGGSFGLQLGGQATDFVLLLMSPKSASSILGSKVKLGGDVSAAAGPVGRNASAETDVTMRAEILSYSRARGLFAGISLAGSTLRPDNDANKKLYGKEVSAKTIVFDKAVPAPPSAKLLLGTLTKRSPKNLSK